jgi:hypothetical protein
MAATLSPEHRAMLVEESSISDAIIVQRGYFTAQAADELTKLGFTIEQARAPALVIPIWSVDGEIVGHQCRPDDPRTGEGGKLIKYETPAGWNMRIDVPPAVQKDISDYRVPLWITEGCKKADSAIVRGLCCIDLIGVWNFRGTNEKGGISELGDWEKFSFKSRRGDGRIVYIAFDSDVMQKPQVRMALQRLSRILQRRGAGDIRPILIPSDRGTKCGLDDFFANGGTVHALGECVDKSLLKGSEIVINNRSLADVSSDAISALHATNYPPTVFVRGGEMVRIVVDERGLTKIKNLGTPALRGILARAATWMKMGKESGTEVSPPNEIVEDLIALGHWPEIPPIISITRAPVLTPEGTLSMIPGYCAKSRVYIASNESWPQWPGTVQEAAKFLSNEVLGDFPFAGDADRAHALGLMMLPIVRPIINGPTPLHLLDAPVQGTGKSLLAKVCLMPTMGAEISATTGTRDEEEWRKKIASSLLEGRAYVFLDNLSRKVDSDTLAGVLTSTEWNDRSLGSLGNINVPVRCVWLATANNAELSRDILRRTVWIRLDAHVERPEDRSEFQHPNIEQWIPEHRRTIVSALCKLVSQWIDSGKPIFSGRKLGSFEEWSRVVGGVLETAGVQGFLGNVQELRAAADADEYAWADFYRRWHTHFGSNPTKAGDLLQEFCVDEQLAGWLGDKGEASRKTRLGHLIRKRIGVVSGGYRVERYDQYGNAIRYRILQLSGETSTTSSEPQSHISSSKLELFEDIEVEEHTLHHKESGQFIGAAGTANLQDIKPQHDLTNAHADPTVNHPPSSGDEDILDEVNL